MRYSRGGNHSKLPYIWPNNPLFKGGKSLKITKNTCILWYPPQKNRIILWSFNGPCNQSEVMCSSSTAKWHLDEPRLSGFWRFRHRAKSMKRRFRCRHHRYELIAASCLVYLDKVSKTQIDKGYRQISLLFKMWLRQHPNFFKRSTTWLDL